MNSARNGFLLGAATTAFIVVSVWLTMDDRLTADVKSGVCHTGKTEMFQPKDLISSTGTPTTPKAYLRQEVICPEVKYWRDPK